MATTTKKTRKKTVPTGPIAKARGMFPRRMAKVRGDRSQRRFAHEIGVFQQNVNRYENGTMPHADFLITLGLKENISLDWLLLGRGDMHRSSR
jgi:transcriptional regulator with XRE-family HTH domain